MSQTPRLGYRYEDLYVGMTFRSPGRTITDADLVAFGFWLSHVPDDHFEAFFDRVELALRPEGRIWFVDSTIHD